MTSDQGTVLKLLKQEFEPLDPSKCKHMEHQLKIVKKRMNRVKVIKCECGKEYRY